MPSANEGSQVAFAAASYGRKQLRFLAPHVHSVAQSHPQATDLLLWHDLPAREVAYLKRAYPNVEFIRLDMPPGGTTDQRISRKMIAWETACQHLADQPICFIDTDTLVLRPINRFLDEPFDFAFTWKDHVWPLNTGVVLVGSGRKALPLLREWAARTADIVGDRALLQWALKHSGGGDQQALRELIGFVNYDRTYERTIAGQTYVLRGLPCEQLNEIWCKPITDRTHIIHYKGGWHPILLEGAPYSHPRPEDACREMHRFWLDTKAAADRHIARQVVAHAWHNHGQASGETGAPDMEVVRAVCMDLGVDAVVTVGDGADESAAALRAGLPASCGVETVTGQPDRALAKRLADLDTHTVGVVADAGIGREMLARLADALANMEHLVAVFVIAKNAAEAATVTRVERFERTLWLADGQEPKADWLQEPADEAPPATEGTPQGPGLLIAFAAPQQTAPKPNRLAPIKRMLLPLAKRLGLR